MIRRPEGPSCYLEADHLVGRSSRAALRLEESYVSSQHAVIRWSGVAWELRDLGSRNGTFVNGSLVPAKAAIRLQKGALLGFGHRDQAWELVDDAPPSVMAVPLDGGPALLAADDMLALPSPEQPLATVFRSADGGWLLECADATTGLRSHQTFEVNGIRYRFSCPDTVSRTATSNWSLFENRTVQEVGLHFRVSSDEEHVELQVAVGENISRLGSRGHNYLLLLLARQRVDDQKAGIANAECGWVYQEELLRWLGASQERLNVDVFRIRRQFVELGLSNAADIVERRTGTRQLRLGTPHIELTGA